MTLLCLLTFALACAAVVWWEPGQVVATPAPLPSTTMSSIVLSGAAKGQVDTLNSQAATLKAEIDVLDTELEKATEAYNAMAVKLDQLNVKMADLRRELATTQADHARRVKMLEDRLVGVYKAGGRDQLMQMLLLSDGVEDLFNRIRVISVLADQDNRLVDNLAASTETLDSILREIDQRKLEELSLRREMEDQRNTIETKLAERKVALADIDRQIDQIIAQEQERQQQEEQLRQSMLEFLTSGYQYEGPLPTNTDTVLAQLIQTATAYLGVPYVWAGDRPSTGFDCSGFTQFVYEQHGITLPHYSGYQVQMGLPVDLTDIQTGDLLAFGYPVHHVGIYLGDGLFIHAPRTGDVVKIQALSDRSDLTAIRRFSLEARIGSPAVR